MILTFDPILSENSQKSLFFALNMNASSFTHITNTGWCLFANRLPGRVNAEQVAQLVGCQPHDIASLVRAKLLRPLGNPPPNAVKYFSSVKLLAACSDERWLDRVTKAISESRRASGQPLKERLPKNECEESVD